MFDCFCPGGPAEQLGQTSHNLFAGLLQVQPHFLISYARTECRSVLSIDCTSGKNLQKSVFSPPPQLGKSFSPPGCTKAFSQLSNLQSHSRCHQSDKPYKCNSCYKCFTDEPALLEHIPKHRDSKHVKTHICAYCGKSYTQVQRASLSIATYARPIPIQETYLAKHMQKHADRVDKRAPINAGPGHSMPGLSDPYWPGFHHDHLRIEI